jgi:hypothetical protein
MSEAVRELRQLLRDLPRHIADSVWRWCYRLHVPVDVMGDQSRAYCMTCREGWPCRGYDRLERDREKAGHEFLPRG